jgi:hypothetical protein
MVITAGTWLSGNVLDLQSAFSLTGPGDIARQIAWPLLFVLSAVAAIRAFQNSAAIIVFAGGLYALLITGFRFLTISIPSVLQSDYLFRSGISSFCWVVFTLTALRYAAAGPSRWLRMAGALTLASFARTLVVALMYSGLSEPDRVSAALAAGVNDAVAGSLVWTASFWLAWTKFGGERE